MELNFQLTDIAPEKSKLDQSQSSPSSQPKQSPSPMKPSPSSPNVRIPTNIMGDTVGADTISNVKSQSPHTIAQINVKMKRCEEAWKNAPPPPTLPTRNTGLSHFGPSTVVDSQVAPAVSFQSANVAVNPSSVSTYEPEPVNGGWQQPSNPAVVQPEWPKNDMANPTWKNPVDSWVKPKDPVQVSRPTNPVPSYYSTVQTTDTSQITQLPVSVPSMQPANTGALQGSAVTPNQLPGSFAPGRNHTLPTYTPTINDITNNMGYVNLDLEYDLEVILCVF